MGNPSVDDIDLKILDILMENARIECKKIAKQVGSSDRTIARRIKKMEEMGIIKGYRIEVNKVLINTELVKVETQTPEEDFIETTASEWDILMSTIKDIFGVGGSVILFNIGQSIGKGIGKTLGNSGKSQNELILNFGQLLKLRGWGEPVYNEIDYEKGTGTMTVSKVPFKNKIAQIMVRGVVCGGMEEITHRRVSLRKEEEESTDNLIKFKFEISGRTT
ncbi:MAG: winged helix-turn-helix transcriptional regulator [Nitrososphaeria archaeon]